MGDFVNLDYKFSGEDDVDKSEYRIHVAISDHLNGRKRKGNQIIEGLLFFLRYSARIRLSNRAMHRLQPTVYKMLMSLSNARYNRIGDT